MKVCIVGWYGTETIGDRGILAGIFDLLTETYGDFEVRLGSLFPFFSRRTFTEDAEFYKALTGVQLKGQIFESKRQAQLDEAIAWSDIVLIGGGPLMHINDLFMLEYAMKKAKKASKRAIVFGCGVGPLFKRRHVPALWGILKHADSVILRDERSLDYLKNLSQSKTERYLDKIKVGIDPSIQSLLKFKSAKHIKENKEPYIAVNLRSFPSEYAKSNMADEVNKKLAQILKDLHVKNPEKEIRMVPMHYFHIGDDDRAFMNHLRFKEGLENLKIQNEPLNLFETMLEFQEAEICYGMRFHSVLFQTILNGNNYVLDYTEPKVGKISGFLSLIDKSNFYQNRYINLQSGESHEFESGLSDSKFAFDQGLLESQIEVLRKGLEPG